MSKPLDNFFFDGDKYEVQSRSDSPDVIVDFYELYDYNQDLAFDLVFKPEHILSEIRYDYFPNRKLVDGSILEKKIRIKNLVETTNIRDLTSEHVGKLIQIKAIVVTSSIPNATIVEAMFECPNCNEELPIKQEGFDLEKPHKCPKCDCRRGFKLLTEKSIREDTQVITLQERPEELPPGEIPEPLTVVLRGNLIRTVTPGDIVRLVGILKLKPIKAKSLDFMKIMETNSIEALNKDFNIVITNEEIRELKDLASKPDIATILIDSFAPSIYGWFHIKESILLSLIGGIRKTKGDLNTRGDIHILLVGDPATAKTQFLLFAAKASIRGIYSSGGGVTGVGLTAALTKDSDGRFVLAAGSMALADMGTACLDELDKMKDDDREKIHPAMEQQIIPISKGGLHATLNSRCATIAACNPTDGQYVIYKTIPENIKKFPPSLLSRFDLIYIMIDDADKKKDEAMVDRILGLDTKNHEALPLKMLKKYIAYSKTITPTISEEILIKLKMYFLEKRQDKKGDGGLQITPRQIESLERLTEASARMHLRTVATEEDGDRAIRLFEYYINETWRDPYTGKVDLNVLEGIPPDSLSKQAEALPSFIRYLCETGKGDTDLQGWFIMRGDLVDEMTESGNIDKRRANDIIEIATQRDLVWFSTYNKVRAP